MPRPIDAEALKKELHCWLVNPKDWRTIPQIVDAQPTIDPAPRWIPVTERLPEKEDRYLCVKRIGISGSVYVAVMNGDSHGFSMEHIYTDDVTHSMPLPKPPEMDGSWIDDGQCSVCGEYDDKDPYGSEECPNCGSKMKKENDNG